MFNCCSSSCCCDDNVVKSKKKCNKNKKNNNKQRTASRTSLRSSAQSDYNYKSYQLNLDELDEGIEVDSELLTFTTTTGRNKRDNNRSSKERDCDIINSSRFNTFRDLCDKFEKTYITPHISKIYSNIPDHDKKIINRLALKRTNEVACMENSVIAKKYWDDEKLERQLLTSRQNEEYAEIIRRNRNYEETQRMNRNLILEETEKKHRIKIQREIDRKNTRIKNRLRNLELQRELDLCVRRQNEFRRLDSVLINNQEQELEEALRREEIYNQLERRISRAECIKDNLIKSYKSRIKLNNQVNKYQHSHNYFEVLKLDEWKKEKLKERIQCRDKRYKKFSTEKNRIAEETRYQAKRAAELREMIKRSISPDNMSFRVTSRPRTIYDRPISNMSYQSHVRLG